MKYHCSLALCLCSPVDVRRCSLPETSHYSYFYALNMFFYQLEMDLMFNINQTSSLGVTCLGLLGACGSRWLQRGLDCTCCTQMPAHIPRGATVPAPSGDSSTSSTCCPSRCSRCVHLAEVSVPWQAASFPSTGTSPPALPGPAELSRRCRGGCGRCPRAAGGAEPAEGVRKVCGEVREGTGGLRERCRGGWRGRAAAAGAGLFIVRENHKRLKRREKV